MVTVAQSACALGIPSTPFSRQLTIGGGNGLSVFIGAHPDDWMGYMTPQTHYDLVAGRSVVIVIVTAGDAGLPAWWWQAREAANIPAVDVLIGESIRPSVSTFYVDSHPMVMMTYSNLVHEIWMRLPDGWGYRDPCGNFTDGKGTRAHNCESLTQLYNGKAATTVDNSTTYSDWSDLTNTVGDLMTMLGVDSATHYYTTDYNRTRNPGIGLGISHPDHIMVGKIVTSLEARGGEFTYVLDDVTSGTQLPTNLSKEEHDLKKSIILAYAQKIEQLTGMNDPGIGTPTELDNLCWRRYETNIYIQTSLTVSTVSTVSSSVQTVTGGTSGESVTTVARTERTAGLTNTETSTTTTSTSYVVSASRAETQMLTLVLMVGAAIGLFMILLLFLMIKRRR
jgi:hypothetical protein